MRGFLEKYRIKTGIIISYAVAFLYFSSALLEGNWKYFFIPHLTGFISLFIVWLLCGLFTNKLTNLTLKTFFRKEILFFYLTSELITLLTSYLTFIQSGMDRSAWNWKMISIFLISSHTFSLLAYSFMLFVYQTLNALAQKEKVLVEKEALEKENAKSKFEALRQQLNPHFLFNSLSSLKALIASNSAEAEKYVVQLSDVYRYLINHRANDLVSLKDEITFIRSYLFLLEIRYEDNLHVSFQVQDEYEKYRLAPLTLQILLENTVKHNIISGLNPLQIKIYTENNNITVSNTLQPRDQVEGSSNFGLYNLGQQYKFLTGKEIDIQKTTTDFSVTIPLIPPIEGT